jgi:hypothetical protein
VFVRKSRPHRGDFDGQKLVCLCESIDRRCRDFGRQDHDCLVEILDRRCEASMAEARLFVRVLTNVVGTLIDRTTSVRGEHGFFKAAFYGQASLPILLKECVKILSLSNQLFRSNEKLTPAFGLA